MIWLVLVGLSILPLSALLFGALFLKLKYSHFNTKAFILFGAIASIIDFVIFYQIYSDTISKGQWTSSSTVMSLFPVLATINVMAFGLLANSLFTLMRSSLNSVKPHKLTHLAIVFGSVLFIGFQLNTHLQNAKTHKAIMRAAGDLTSDLIEQIKSEYEQNNNRTVFATLLSNPQIDQQTLQEYATSDDVEFISASLANPNISSELVNKLAQSTHEIVRYYVASNKKTADDVLAVLLNDPSKEVRGQAKTEYNLRKKQ